MKLIKMSDFYQTINHECPLSSITGTLTGTGTLRRLVLWLCLSSVAPQTRVPHAKVLGGLQCRCLCAFCFSAVWACGLPCLSKGRIDVDCVIHGIQSTNIEKGKKEDCSDLFVSLGIENKLGGWK